MSLDRSKLNGLAGLAALLSLVACYGTLALVAVLAALGVTIALNEVVWAGAIVVFAGLATGGLGLGFSRHRLIWPVLVGGLGTAAIAYAMFVHYSRAVELIGFALLCAGVVWDWRLRRDRGLSTNA